MANNSGPTDRRTRTNDASEPRHPYETHEGSELWKLISQGINDLVTNGDLEERTSREHIVGYLCKVVSSAAGSSKDVCGR